MSISSTYNERRKLLYVTAVPNEKGQLLRFFQVYVMYKYEECKTAETSIAAYV